MNPPIILAENKYTSKVLKELRESSRVWKERDIYKDQLLELFEVINPRLNKNNSSQLDKFIQSRTNSTAGSWVYFSWSGELVHMVGESDYFQLRTNRNQNLITREEQQLLAKSCIGIAGLSVGSGAAVGLAYQGIAKSLKLAEFDRLDTTNLNRIRAGIHQIGLPKISIVARQLYEINPYVNLITFPDGLTLKNLNQFVNKKPKPDLIFEIIDDFEMKIRLRIEAKKAGIPVIVMANLGDSLLIDIERFDLDKNLPLFNGLLGDLPEEILKEPEADRNQYAIKMVGSENVPHRALESVKEIGRSLVGRPQLSSTVTISGGIAAYLARMVVLKRNLRSGRYKISFDNLFDITDNSQ